MYFSCVKAIIERWNGGESRDSLKVRHLNGDVVGQSEEGERRVLFCRQQLLVMG